MNRMLQSTLITLLLLSALMILFTACSQDTSDSGDFTVNPPPEAPAVIIPEGTFYVRCSEPEENRFSVQFVGAVPTCYVDYVGFEANKLYADGTRGSISAVKIRTLHKSVTDANRGITLTSADFGIEDGYLFARALEKIPIDEENLRYEIAAYYVIDDEKVYTAKQTFSIQTLLEEHILSNPTPFEIKEESGMIDVQQWVKYTLPEGSKVSVDENGEPTGLSDTYYLGASAPNQNGYIKMYLCYALPSANNTTVGIRYNFTETEGEYQGVNTQIRRERTQTLYQSVISESETLTVENFGLTEGCLAVVGFSDDLNTVLCKTYQLNLLAYYSRNALEHTVVNAKHLFSDLIKDCVRTNYSAEIGTYTYIPTDYTDWVDFKEENENAVGDGFYKIRVSTATNVDGTFKFSLQIASAVPTRFSERIAFVYTAYDKNGEPIYSSYDENGKPIGTAEREISVTTLYPSIIGNADGDITSKDFGFARGYVATMLLNNISLTGEVAAFKIDLYYRTGTVKNYVSSLTLSLEELSEMVEIVL